MIKSVCNFIPTPHASQNKKPGFERKSPAVGTSDISITDLAVPLLAMMGFSIVIFGAAVISFRRRLGE